MVWQVALSSGFEGFAQQQLETVSWTLIRLFWVGD